MDRQAEAKRRYDQLKKTLNDDGVVRRKVQRARALGLAIVGVWAVLPVLLWSVDLEDAASPEFFRRPTAHEAYLLDLVHGEGGTAAVRAWEAASWRSIDEPLRAGGAYREAGVFPDEDPLALGLRVHVPEGQRLHVDVTARGEQPGRLFLDLFRAAPDTLRRPARVESGELADGRWTFDADETADYVLRLQPELEAGFEYDLTLRVGARWIFPVAGAGEVDIGSVFGDPRDGGRREHHGVDIFQSRGTPVLAAADGLVRRVDTTEIGGRVVWLREDDGEHNIYYAHLERPLVEEGQRLRAGDTVGLVGNTGNARTTPPHLHFGAYRRGAVDPWNLILPQPPPVPTVSVDLEAVGMRGEVNGDGTELRRRASSGGAVLAELPRGASVWILAGAGQWYRVLSTEGKLGYIDGAAASVPLPDGSH
jgi:murein DD-endopeptidase MepM/ murein hydrolase activator NlpD